MPRPLRLRARQVGAFGRRTKPLARQKSPPTLSPTTEDGWRGPPAFLLKGGRLVFSVV